MNISCSVNLYIIDIRSIHPEPRIVYLNVAVHIIYYHTYYVFIKDPQDVGFLEETTQMIQLSVSRINLISV